MARQIASLMLVMVVVIPSAGENIIRHSETQKLCDLRTGGCFRESENVLESNPRTVQ